MQEEMQEQTQLAAGPLAGLRVLELGQMVAGPFTGRLLAEFGAEVIKVEPPGQGDPLRSWRLTEDGVSLWWRVQARNKQCISIDLRQSRGQELVRRLVADMDVLIENFRPGTLEKWGLGPTDLWQLNPRLIVVRISGFGQSGPYRDLPGLGSVAEAMGGIRQVSGYPDRPPVRANISLGDSLAGLYAAYATMLAVYERDTGSGCGQVVDVALYEAVFGMMEGLVPEYDRLGVERGRHGNRIPGVAPQGTYPCRDGDVVIGANSDSLFRRLAVIIGRDQWLADESLQDNAGRARRADELDAAIAAWTAPQTTAAVVATLRRGGVPVGTVYTAARMFADPHFAARRMIERVALDQGDAVALPGIVPRLSRTPGVTRWAGPTPVGAHTHAVLRRLGLAEAELEQLQAEGVI